MNIKNRPPRIFIGYEGEDFINAVRTVQIVHNALHSYPIIKIPINESETYEAAKNAVLAQLSKVVDDIKNDKIEWSGHFEHLPK